MDQEEDRWEGAYQITIRFLIAFNILIWVLFAWWFRHYAIGVYVMVSLGIMSTLGLYGWAEKKSKREE